MHESCSIPMCLQHDVRTTVPSCCLLVRKGPSWSSPAHCHTQMTTSHPVYIHALYNPTQLGFPASSRCLLPRLCVVAPFVSPNAACGCGIMHCHTSQPHTCAPALACCLLPQLGAATYACRIPERWFPGKFDIAGHSHQLWHAAVVLAAWVHYLAIMILLQWRDAAGALAPSVFTTSTQSALRTSTHCS
jgi:hypothetical protein